MRKILEIKNLSIHFKVENQENLFNVVRNINFDLFAGEVLGIVGESGSGKSVTALSILSLLQQNKAVYGDKSSIIFENKELITSDINLLNGIRGNKIGFVFQEPMSSLNPLHQIGDQIAENIMQHQKKSYSKSRQKAVELLELVGIKNAVHRVNSYPHELSGGQRQRVMIAMAIANNPSILIADEPTTALDVTVQEQIIKLILELKNRFKMAVIFISHDLQLVRKISDRIIVMHQGNIVEENTTDRLFEAPKHSYTKKLISSSLSLKKNKKNKTDLIASIKGVTVEYPMKKNLFGKITQTLKALNNVSFNLYKGETLGVVGESGSGKTTLGMCFTNLIKYEGKINLKENLNKKDFRKNVQIVFQDPYNSLNPRFNVFQIISEGLRVHFSNLDENKYKEKTIAILKDVGLSENDLYKYPHEFSGGQRQRIAIARALILHPKIVVLDEPTSALDVTVQSQIVEMLKNLQKKYEMTYIFISHDMRAIKSISDRIAVMKDGNIVEISTSANILSNPQKAYTKELIRASLI
ncbi:MAG: ABC transporter ATP-binding protein [Alphaproteobacteria bacterium]|nr:ABC transporter ATP-binding protein [Alphaproteobacteria bacterium]